MCNHCRTTNHRKIYENHIGKIPIDETGRTYEIHHIDGNHSNNDPINLEAITIQEHYDIHFEQMDWYACVLIAFRMNKSPEDISRLATLSNLKRSTDGTHNLLKQNGGSEKSRERVLKLLAEGRHPSQNPVVIEKMIQAQNKRVARGDHNLQGDKNPVHELIKNGTFHALKQNGGSEKSKERNLKLLAEGRHSSQNKENIEHLRQLANEKVANRTHHLLKENGGSERARKHALERVANGTHPSQQEYVCHHCDKIGKGGAMIQWHFDNCKFKQKSNIVCEEINH